MEVKKKLSREETLRQIAEIDKLLNEAKRQDPFWYFEPSDGRITEEGTELLKKYLKPDDIPQRLDSQKDLFASKASIKGASGGNQSGKSTFGSLYGYIWITGEIPDGLKGIFPEETLLEGRNRDIRVVGVSNKQLMNTVLPTWQKWVPRKYLAKGKWSESFSSEQKKLFLYKDGVGEPIGTVEFMTNEQDVESFQGPPLGLVIYDEEPLEKIRKENLMRFITAGQLNEVFCWTPTAGLTWATDLFSDEADEKGRSIDLCKFASVTNKQANLKVMDEICGEIEDYNTLKMRLLGEFVSLSGLVYGKLFDSKIHIIQPFEANNDDYLCLVGLDPHLVTNTAMVFALMDRENNVYIDRCYFKSSDTEELKADFHKIVKENNYRVGWSVADKSSNSSIIAFGGRNIFKELSQGSGAITSLRTSEKFEGSIKAGVDEIKKRLRVNDKTGKPRFFIVDRPENKVLVQTFKTLERDAHINEDTKGERDKIREGKHHLHAAMRYIFQFPMSWYPKVIDVPEPEFQDEELCW